MQALIRKILPLLLAAGPLSLLALAVTTILAHHDINHPENIVPWATYKITGGLPLYTDWRIWPHHFMPYGPLLSYPLGLIFRLFGQGDYGFQYYMAGRLQSGLFLLGLGVCVAAIFKRAGARSGIAYIGSFAYMSLWAAIMLTGVSFRADVPALFWALFAAMAAFGMPSGRKSWVLAMLAFIVSIAYKPALWAFPAAFAIYFCYIRQYRSMLIWGGTAALLVILYVVLSELATGGMFLLNQVGASSMGFSTSTFTLTKDLLLNTEPFPIFTWDIFFRFLGAIAVALVLIKKSEKRLDVGFSIYYLTALLLNLLTMLKVGSGLNYVLEAYVLSGVVLGLGLIRVWNDKYSVAPIERIIFFSFIALSCVLPIPYHTYKNFKTAWEASRTLQAPSPYTALASLPSSAYLGDLVFIHPASQAHVLTDPLPYVQLVKRGLIDREHLAERIRNQAFSHMVLSPGTKYLFMAEDKAPWAGELLDHHYTLQLARPEYEIWVPKPDESTSPTTTNPNPNPAE